jgi:hypothetical protein
MPNHVAFSASNGAGERMFTSGLVGIIVTLVVIGLLLYLVDLIPMDRAIKQIIRIIVIIAVVVWLLQAFGLIGSLNSIFHPAPVRVTH